MGTRPITHRAYEVRDLGRGKPVMESRVIGYAV
jgi:hypothetical protein